MTSARGREGQESKDQEIHQENDGFREARHEERSQAVAEYFLGVVLARIWSCEASGIGPLE